MAKKEKKKRFSATKLHTSNLFLSLSVNCFINLFICILLKPDVYHLGKHFFVLGIEKIILFPERHPKPLCLICVVNRTFCVSLQLQVQLFPAHLSFHLKSAQATHWVNGRSKLSLMSCLSRAFFFKKAILSAVFGHRHFLSEFKERNVPSVQDSWLKVKKYSHVNVLQEVTKFSHGL